MKIFNFFTIICLLLIGATGFGIKSNIENVIVQREGRLVKAVLIKKFKGSRRTSSSADFSYNGVKFSSKVPDRFLDSCNLGDSADFLLR